MMASPASPHAAAPASSRYEGNHGSSNSKSGSRSIKSSSKGSGSESAELQNSQDGSNGDNISNADSDHDNSQCAAATGSEHQDGNVGVEPPTSESKLQVHSHCSDHGHDSSPHSGNASEDDLAQPADSMLPAVQLDYDSYAGIVGTGVTGYVKAYWFGDVLAAVKSAWLDSEEAQDVIDEACIYNILKPLWGEIVPEVIEHGVVYEQNSVILATRLLHARELDLHKDQDVLPQVLQQFCGYSCARCRARRHTPL